MAENHRKSRVGVTIDEMPLMLADVFAVNKVFRKDFWKRAALSFHTGIAYEDQVTLTEAFLTGSHFDVLSDTVYHWRVRHDGSSITQRRYELQNLHDRLATKRMTLEIVQRCASSVVASTFKSRILAIDMVEYFEAVPGCSDEYWKMLHCGMIEFWGDGRPEFTETHITAEQRLMGWLVLADRRSDLEALIREMGGLRSGLPLEVRRDHVVLAVAPFEWLKGVPFKAIRLAKHELRWVARLLAFEWCGPVLKLHGFALIRNVPTSGQSIRAEWKLVDGDDDTSIDIPVEERRDPHATAWVNQPSRVYDDAGFYCEIDLRWLVGDAPSGEEKSTSWRFRGTVCVAEICDSGTFTTWTADVVNPVWHCFGDDLWARLVVSHGEVVLQTCRGARPQGSG
jgi:hypothetical protein